MGPTKVFQARYNCVKILPENNDAPSQIRFSQPSSLRGQFGLTDTRNCCHGSDSEATANREMCFFFPTFDPSSFPTEEAAEAWEGGELALFFFFFLPFFLQVNWLLIGRNLLTPAPGQELMLTVQRDLFQTLDFSAAQIYSSVNKVVYREKFQEIKLGAF